MQSKNEIGYQVLLAMHACNMADTYDIDDQKINDLPYECSRDNNAYGNLSAALDNMGFSNARQAYVDTGDIPDYKHFKADDGVTSVKITPAQVEVFTKNSSVTGYDDLTLYPLIGSGQYRSAYAMAARGYGEVVSSSHNYRHPANYFFKLKVNTKFNFSTKVIEVW